MSDFVTADFHFDHKGILGFERHCFKTVDEHNEAIIRGLNTALGPNDCLYVLGDVGFRKDGSLEHLAALIRRIECGRKVLVFGNHDHFSEIEAISVLGFDEAHKGPIFYPSKKAPGKIILSHEPVREAYLNPYVINVHGHIHNGSIDAEGYHNVNIAHTGYKPRKMSRYEAIAEKTCKSRTERFGNEWYFPLYNLKKPEGGQ